MLQDFNDIFIRVDALFSAKKIPKLKTLLRGAVNNVSNLTNLLLRKSLLRENLYNYSDEISHEFFLPDEKEIYDKDKSRIMYDRLRAFMNALEFQANNISNDFDGITIEYVNNLNKLLSYFTFQNFNNPQANLNTKTLREMVDKLIASNDQILKRVIIDNLKLLEDNFKKIKIMIDEITEYKKEKYKVNIRFKIFPYLKEDFSEKLLKENPNEFINKLVKIMEKDTPDIPVKKEWLFESIKYCYSTNEKDALEKVKSSYLAVESKDKDSTNVMLSPREKLILIIEQMASSSIILEKIYILIDQNLKLTKGRKKSFFEQFFLNLKKAMNAETEDEFFHIEYINPSTKEVKNDTVNIHDFMLGLKKKIMLLNEITRKDSQANQKIKMGKEDALYKFLENTYFDLLLLKERILGVNSEIRLKVSRKIRVELKEIEEPLEKLDEILKKTQEMRRKYVIEQEALLGKNKNIQDKK